MDIEKLLVFNKKYFEKVSFNPEQFKESGNPK
jgi:hypothetical protein